MWSRYILGYGRRDEKKSHYTLKVVVTVTTRFKSGGGDMMVITVTYKVTPVAKG